MKLYRKIWVAVALGLAIIAGTSVASAKEKDKASIKFEKSVYDFGNIREDGGPVSCEFEFVNDGTGNLVIVSATAECGCTKPEFPKNPIAPGKTGQIKVSYAPLGRPGAFDKVVTVKCNGKPKKVHLKIRGTVIPKK